MPTNFHRNLNKDNLYYYGIYNNGSKLVTFVVRSISKIPENSIIVKEIIGVSANDLALDLLKEYRSGHIGSILEYNDGDKNHSAICLGKYNGELMLLFLTSNDKWNPFCRQVKQEEMAFFLFTKQNRATYFAPVCRDERYASWTGRKIPDYRVKELKTEFFPDFRMDEIVRL